MSSLHTRNETGSAGGAGGELPPSALPAVPSIQDEDDDAYKRRLKLTDVIGFVALNGYACEADACAGLNRETWRCIPAGLSAADADRVRRDHPLWQAIIDLKHGHKKNTRLMLAAQRGNLARARELCDWRADVEATDYCNETPLFRESYNGHHEVVRELLSHGANANAAIIHGYTALIMSSFFGHVEVVRVLLAAGADKHRVSRDGRTATSEAGLGDNPGSRAILALLAAAP
jgi:hypothetical protein